MLSDMYLGDPQSIGSNYVLGDTKEMATSECIPLHELELHKTFRRSWRSATDSNRLTLFGFRRFRTSQLINLRFLEEDVARIDRKLYQAGLQLENGKRPKDQDILGLNHSQKDENTPPMEKIIKEDLKLELRSLMHEYNTALQSFNAIMRMETFSLIDNDFQANLRKDLNKYELYKTRHIRVDLPPTRGSKDLVEHTVRKYLRKFWFYVRRGGIGKEHNPRDPDDLEANLSRNYQNTALMAEIITRVLIAMLGGASLVVPLVILSAQSSNKAHLITVAVCILIFSFIIAIISRSSKQDMLVATTAYAAVLTVFVSNNPSPSN